jgi:hypothetical protein
MSLEKIGLKEIRKRSVKRRISSVLNKAFSVMLRFESKAIVASTHCCSAPGDLHWSVDVGLLSHLLT